MDLVKVKVNAKARERKIWKVCVTSQLRLIFPCVCCRFAFVRAGWNKPFIQCLSESFSFMRSVAFVLCATIFFCVIVRSQTTPLPRAFAATVAPEGRLPPMEDGWQPARGRDPSPVPHPEARRLSQVQQARRRGTVPYLCLLSQLSRAAQDPPRSRIMRYVAPFHEVNLPDVQLDVFFLLPPATHADSQDCAYAAKAGPAGPVPYQDNQLVFGEIVRDNFPLWRGGTCQQAQNGEKNPFSHARVGTKWASSRRRRALRRPTKSQPPGNPYKRRGICERVLCVWGHGVNSPRLSLTRQFLPKASPRGDGPIENGADLARRYDFLPHGFFSLSPPPCSTAE